MTRPAAFFVKVVWSDASNQQAILGTVGAVTGVNPIVVTSAASYHIDNPGIMAGLIGDLIVAVAVLVAAVALVAVIVTV